MGILCLFLCFSGLGLNGWNRSDNIAGWWRNFWIYKRSTKARENASRPCIRNFAVLLGHDAAGSSSSDPRYDRSQGCQPAATPLLPDLHEGDWRVQGVTGNRPDNVALRPHHRCSITGGSSPSSRTTSLACHLPGAVSRRPWRLADSIPTEFGRGPSTVDLPGQDQHHQPWNYTVLGGDQTWCKCMFFWEEFSLYQCIV